MTEEDEQKERFTVLKKNEVFWVYDRMAKEFNLPDMAVNLYFAWYSSASGIAATMNTEWKMFLQNPS